MPPLSGPSMMTDFMVCFSCCISPQPQPKRRRIDRSMIGLPTNFVHTGHVGSGDVGNVIHLDGIQNQMSEKGGYDHTSPVNVQLHVIDIKEAEMT